MEQQFLDIYNEAGRQIQAGAASVFNTLRDDAARKAQKLPFPTPRTEAYLYCPVFEALKTNWGLNVSRMLFGMTPEQKFHCAVPGIKATMSYMVNDVWANADAEIDLGNGAYICSMRHASEAHKDILQRYFNTIQNDGSDGFAILSDMLVQDGYLVHVPKNTTVQMPVQFVNMMHAGQPLMGMNRNLIVIEDMAAIDIIDCDHTMDKSPYFIMRHTEVFVGNGARFNYCMMENTHDDMNSLRRMTVSAEAGSDTHISLFELENGQSRNHVEVNLNGPGANVWLGGMLLADKKQRTDNYTVIRHHAPHCTSRELFKYILDDSAVGAFSGRIVVDHGAQKTESYQTNRNICISPDARALGRPQLEIYADDVKCGHGATTGMLDEAALFYMRQRGIGYKEARMLLLQAFSAEVLEHISSPALADRLRLLIEKRLRGEHMHCAGCIKQ